MYDIFIISDDVVGRKMAGPGIRAWELSKSLAKHFKVVLGIPDYSSKEEDDSFLKSLSFDVIRYSVEKPKLLQKIGLKSRIILTQGYILSKFPFLKDLSAYLIIDLYVPFPLENLFVHKWKIPKLIDREYIHLKDLKVFNDQILCGDHFLCANERQRDLFMGALMSLNRINPEVLDTDASLKKLISIVPFGISEERIKGANGQGIVPVREKQRKGALRSKIPNICEDDIILLWGGVITNWFDPKTLIKAMAEVVKKEPRVKLFFLSTKHPNPLLPEFDMAKEAVDLAKSLGLENKSIFFNKEWIDYDERGAYFKDADIGVSIHETHFETVYSFRTRILDYLKFDLPVLCTEGDFFAGLVEKEKLGITVTSGKAEELAQAIITLTQNKGMRIQMIKNIKKIKPSFYWDRVTEPLVEYIKSRKNSKSRKNRENREGRKRWRNIFWKWGQKLPLRISAKLRRIFRI